MFFHEKSELLFFINPESHNTYVIVLVNYMHNFDNIDPNNQFIGSCNNENLRVTACNKIIRQVMKFGRTFYYYCSA